MYQVQTLLKRCLVAGLFVLVSHLTQAQCSGGVAPQTIVHTYTMNNNSGIASYNFTMPKFPPSAGTLIAVRLNAHVTMPDFGYSLENNSGFASNSRVRIGKEDFLTSSAFSGDVFGNILYSSPNYNLSATDGVPGSGPDYRDSSGIPAWTQTPILNNVRTSGLAAFTGMDQISFQYDSEVFQGWTGSIDASLITSGSITTVFTMTYEYCPAAILNSPIQQFQASKLSENSVSLSWVQPQDALGNSYVPQWSKDGVNWGNFPSVSSLGNGQQRYRVTAPIQGGDGQYFFRIQHREMDGKISYTVIRQLQFGGTSATALRIFPNPSNGSTGIEIKSSKAKNWQVQVMQADGRMVWNTRVSPAMGYSRLQMPGHLAQGWYVVRVYDAENGETHSGRIYIQR